MKGQGDRTSIPHHDLRSQGDHIYLYHSQYMDSASVLFDIEIVDSLYEFNFLLSMKCQYHTKLRAVIFATFTLTEFGEISPKKNNF